MKFITNIKHKFITQKPQVLLGRWNIMYCQNTINKKIDLANEDHCGICNQYDNKLNKNDNKIDVNDINDINDVNRNYYNINKMIFFETI